jgi:hypothetical protein
MNKTIPFVSPVSPFLAQDPFSPTTSSPPNPPSRDHQLRLVLPTPNILDPSLLSLQSSPPPSPHPYTNQKHHHHQQRLQHLQQQEPELTYFPFHAHLHLDDTAICPGTAPASASFFSSKPFTGLASSSPSRPDLSTLHSGFGQSNLDTAGDHPMSPQPHDSSPFYFHPPSDSNSSNSSVSYHQHQLSPPANNSNPRKRAFAGPDRPHDESSYTVRGGELPSSSSGPYEYGSKSRPQSRHFTVMELL